MFSPTLVDKCATLSATAATDRCFCWSKFPLAVISDSGRYFEIIFSLSPLHVAKDPSLIAWIRVSLFGQKRI